MAESAARGRAARIAVPRAQPALWNPPAGRADPVDLLERQAATRVPELGPIRYGRMLASEFAFFRGAAAIMAADLAATPDSGLRVQQCGDAHLGNFGGFKSPERTLIFDINDFDETLPGPWEWDVKRLAASLAILSREYGCTTRERRAIISRTVREYREAMARFATLGSLDVWYARLDVTGVMSRWHLAARDKAARRLDRAAARADSKDNLAAFDKLTHLVDGEPRIASRPPLLVPEEELGSGDPMLARARVQDCFERYRASLAHDRRHLLGRFRFVHFARNGVGVGSVGTRAWVVLLIDEDSGQPLLLQFKEAQPSVLTPYVGKSVYVNQGRRVVEGQRHLQAASDVFLGWTSATGTDGVGRDFYARQLWDGKISADTGRMSVGMLSLYGQMCAWTLARAHARSGDRIAIAAYLGSSRRFDDAVADFAEAYADQSSKDRAALAAAVRSGRVTAQPGV